MHRPISSPPRLPVISLLRLQHLARLLLPRLILACTRLRLGSLLMATRPRSNNSMLLLRKVRALFDRLQVLFIVELAEGVSTIPLNRALRAHMLCS